jgi:hypothetical protein
MPQLFYFYVGIVIPYLQINLLSLWADDSSSEFDIITCRLQTECV